ncbi:MAG: ArsR/SmtB family transcription factor [Fidelibacterota bacterium]
MRDHTKIFKALSDEGRLRILNLLAQKPLCVCEITEILQLATSTVSKHLSILREAGFIIDKKDGKWVNYYLNDAADKQIRSLTTLLNEWLKENETVGEDLAKLATVNRNKICGVKHL